MKWIKCSEQMSPENKRVLFWFSCDLCDKGNNSHEHFTWEPCTIIGYTYRINHCMCDECHGEDENCEISFNIDTRYNHSPNDPSHWMLLPESPKE